MRVTWTTDEDLQCAILASMGFSTAMICERTGLTPCQVSYRLNKASIKRKDYRDGRNEMAERVINQVVPSNKSSIRALVGVQPIIVLKGRK